MEKNTAEKLYEAFYMKVFSYVMTLTGNRNDAMDITQETFLRAISTSKEFRGESECYTWLCAIARNIFIDENGDYYRTGEYLRWDCNIAEKMALKEELLKKVLVDDGIEDIQIRSIVVFTDNRIEVQNKYSRIRTCFVSQLAYIIDGFKSSTNMSEEEMEHIEGLIKEAECKEAYPFEFDVAQYKMDFATLMAVLEEVSAKAEEPEYERQ